MQTQCLILYCHKLLPNLDNGRKVCSAFFITVETLSNHFCTNSSLSTTLISSVHYQTLYIMEPQLQSEKAHQPLQVLIYICDTHTLIATETYD